MTADLPAHSVAAIVTILAALITSSFSFVSLTLNKEQKTSEFRQAWIDGLRQDLAIFFASARSFARAFEEQRAFASGLGGAPLALTPERVSDTRYQAAEARYRIQLRLNPEKPPHVELLQRMQLAVDEQNNAMAAGGDTTKTIQAIDDAAAFAPQILKAEWERVKRGELAFRVARNWLAPGIVIASLVLVGLIWAGRIRL